MNTVLKDISINIPRKNVQPSNHGGSSKVNVLFINKFIFCTHPFYLNNTTNYFYQLTHSISNGRQQVGRPVPIELQTYTNNGKL